MADDRSKPGSAYPSEAEIDAVLAEFGGDAREAIRALLHDLAALAADFEANVSHGFVRGDVPALVRRRA